MSDTTATATPPPLTGLDLWTPNDYSNFITISAAAIGTTLLVLFKSRCVKINICWGLWSCDREILEEDEVNNSPTPPPDMLRPQPSSRISGALSTAEPEPEPEQLRP